jgi:hypothetical protein
MVLNSDPIHGESSEEYTISEPRRERLAEESPGRQGCAAGRGQVGTGGWLPRGKIADGKSGLFSFATMW